LTAEFTQEKLWLVPGDGSTGSIYSTTHAARAWLLTLAAVGILGCGHSNNSTGPTSTTTAQFNFGNNSPRTVDAFGDSITFGTLEERKIGFGLDTVNNYPNGLQKLLQKLDPAWRVINRGVGGEVVQDGATRIGIVLPFDHPGFILIMEGTNNASRCDDAAFIVNNLRTMVDAAKANKTIPLLGTIPPNFRSPTCAQDVIDEANTMIRGLAAAEGIVLAEIFDGMNNRSLFGLGPDRDPLHPNEQGYAVMASIWFNALKQAIPAGGTAVALHHKK
jgi:lysophospholipase L1-like esterase